jgi:hypothetical protein
MDILELKEHVDKKQLEINEKIDSLKKEIKRLKIEAEVYENLHFFIVDNITEEQREEWKAKYSK